MFSLKWRSLFVKEAEALERGLAERSMVPAIRKQACLVIKIWRVLLRALDQDFWYLDLN